MQSLNMLKEILKKFNHNKKDLQGMTLIAGFWSFIGSAGNGVIRLTSNLILTRLLFPEAFGLMATAMLLMTLLQVFSDTGVKTALIQHPKGKSKEFINTSFIITLVRNSLLFIIVTLSIQPISNFYVQPSLQPLLWIMSFTFLLEALINPSLAILVKDMRIEKQVLYNIGSQFAGFVLTIILTVTLGSAIALAWGYLLTSVFRVVISYLIDPYRPKLQWDPVAGRELIHFGKYILLNTMIAWVAFNFDRLMIGKLLGMELLGIYNIALYLGVFLTEILVQIFANSYFPAICSIASDRERVQNIYRRSMKVIVSVAIPLALLLAVFSHDIIRFLYDPRYHIAGVALFWISLRSAVGVIVNLQSSTLLALGKPKLVTLSNSIGLIILFFMLPAFTRQYGLTGTGVSILGSSLIVGVTQLYFLRKYVQFNLTIVLKPWLQFALNTLLVIGVYHFLAKGLQTPSPNNFILIILTSLATLSLIYMQIKSQLSEILGSFVLNKRV
jgi:O-antigen/teichoic acid export membrane protein